MDVDVGARGTVVLAPPSLRLTALPPLSCALAGRLEAELAEVQSWPAEDLRTGHQGAVLAAVARLQALLVEQSGETTRLIAEAAELEGRLQQARAELRTTAAGVNDAAAASLHADPAGLRAAVAAAEEAEHAAQEQAARSAQRVEQTHAQLREAEVLHAREASLDSHISALCAADAQLAREWREGSWAVSEFVGGTLLAAPVEQLGHELLAAQREELELELRPAAAASCSDGGLEAPPPSAAVLRLDPLAALKTPEHAAEVLARASAELEQLQPVAREWGASAERAAARMQELQQGAEQAEAAAAGEEAEVAALVRQLEATAADAEQGAELVDAVRTALGEWWSCPALHATPWIKRERGGEGGGGGGGAGQM